MIGLYGTQSQYLQSIREEGFSRPSAAFFRIPEAPEPDTLGLTLTCAVYHAVGLSVLQAVAQTGRTIGQVLKDQGQAGLVFVWMDCIPERETRWDRYQIGERLTYPYTKLSSFGPVNTGCITVTSLDASFFDVPVAAPSGPVPRFFQKHRGAPQLLGGVDMEKLEKLCFRAAEALMEKGATLWTGS